MTSEDSELKLALDVLLDDMSRALAAVRRRQILIVDLHDPEYVLALERYERTRQRWLFVLNDLRGRQASSDSQSVTQIDPNQGKSSIG